ncbi:type II toxin-antitoxin system RelE/ParE family toxin [Salinisphaera sp. P385]|uniref:Type II toxin-antitoxin system RelE/ParE family toxin n=1 Tax=Spectribacter acetivorans TaxID=3075603 RepID=A0ABU3B4G4_9GAMM|nr:type II toxin-antitoxin system RelE/ParE family toxin [Salinisphaera sp. P385]MDT0616955.1 type II toxin-antitoxin system RelE/ParE family toxin [Salinisphaera sp. P385]
MRLEWTEPALDDLTRLSDHIGRDSTVYAYQFISRIFDAGAQLADFPRLGREVPEATDATGEVRELLFRDYRIIYRLEPGEVVRILTVIHGARDLAGDNGKPWE